MVWLLTNAGNAYNKKEQLILNPFGKKTPKGFKTADLSVRFHKGTA